MEDGQNSPWKFKFLGFSRYASFKRTTPVGLVNSRIGSGCPWYARRSKPQICTAYVQRASPAVSSSKCTAELETAEVSSVYLRMAKYFDLNGG
ncbi:hypothetical protein LWI28_012618 [Acer negundo]|uniref:Uncharacterized protein n=1 Tax=Acer negundo TaxID=4023 RepID=A0AAD5P728_ACENE|nr:hypothetical protein LWI28_012618 [Acer negundo]